MGACVTIRSADDVASLVCALVAVAIGTPVRPRAGHSSSGRYRAKHHYASQLTRSAPLYGKHFFRKSAFAKRFGATVGDDTSQNFFADFVLASMLHEDTRYIREGHSRKLWARIGYAISRAVVTRTDSGARTFNSANVVGCAMSAGLSNAYYPPVSRTAAVAAVNWGTNIAGAGLTNLMPEFGPDIGHWIKQHLTFSH
jgi:hypothetical protein